MTKCISNSYIFPTQNGKKIVANFNGGLISSDGGSIWLKMIDDKIGLLTEVSKKMTDS